MKYKLKNRIKSDRADSNSVSNILWMAIAVVIVVVVGGVIINALQTKSTAIEECINSSGLSINASDKCNVSK